MRRLHIYMTLLWTIASQPLPISSDTSSSICEAFAGNGICDDETNIEDCDWDGGDCCVCTCVGDNCDEVEFDCQDPDGGDCVTPTPTTPVLTVAPTTSVPTPVPTLALLTPTPTQLPTVAPTTPTPTQLTPAPTAVDACAVFGGNGECDEDFNNEECDWDGGDCCACTCQGDGCGSVTFDCLDPDVPTDCEFTPAPITSVNETTPSPSSIVTASVATTALAGGGMVAAGIGGLVGSGGTAMGTSASSMMSLGLDQLAVNIHSEAEATAHGISLRQPSIALTFVVASQLQFLGSLSLVHNTQGPLGEFLENFTSMNLRWLFPSSITIAEDATTCKFTSDEMLNSTLEFWGNSVLIVGGLICIFFVHVAIASGIETYMILKARALDAISTARSRGISINELSSRVLGRQRGTHSLTPLDSRDIEDSGEPSSLGSETGEKDTDAHSDRDELMECRDKSKSVWLHFPHLELVFLFFAFQGAVTSQLQALRHSVFSCPSVFFTALTFLALYPTLMVILVTRAIFIRVLPEALIEFRYFASDVGDGNSWISRIKKGWVEDRSLLTWGNRGHWHTVENTDKEKWREGNRFRVGFEPLFVDFTKSGIWFVLFSFFKSTVIACVGALIDDSERQLLLLCALHTISLVMLVVLKPFANTILNGMAGISAVADALTTGLIAASARKWVNPLDRDEVEFALVWINIVVLCVAVIPTYIDAAAGIIDTIRRKLHHVRDISKIIGPEEYQTNKQVRAFVRGYFLSMAARTWCTMFKRNISACAKDTTAGVRKPREPQVKAKAKRHHTLDSDDHSEDIGYSGQGADRSEWLRVSRGPVIDNLPHRRATFEGCIEACDVPRNNQCDRDTINDLNSAVGNHVEYKGTLVTNDLPRRRTFDQALLIDQISLSSCMREDESPMHGHISLQIDSSDVATRERHWGRGSLSGPKIDYHPRRSIGFQQPSGENTDNAGKTNKDLESAQSGYSAKKRGHWNNPIADMFPRPRQAMIFPEGKMSSDDVANPNSTFGKEKSEANVEIRSKESGAWKTLLMQRKLDSTSLTQVDIPRRKFFSGSVDRKNEERAYRPEGVRGDNSHADAKRSKKSSRLEDNHPSVLPSQRGKPPAEMHNANIGSGHKTVPIDEEMETRVSDCRSKNRDQQAGDRGHTFNNNTIANLRGFAGWPTIYHRHEGSKPIPVPLELPRRRPSYFDVATEKSPTAADSANGIDLGRDRIMDNASDQPDALATWSNHYDINARSIETGRCVDAKSNGRENTTETFARRSSGIDSPTMLQGNQIPRANGMKQPESTCTPIGDGSIYLADTTRGSNTQGLPMTREATSACFRLDVHDPNTFEKEEKAEEKYPLRGILATEKRGGRPRQMECFEGTAPSLRDFTSHTGKYEYPIWVKLPDNGKIAGPKSSEAQRTDDATTTMNIKKAPHHNGPATQSAPLHPLVRERKTRIRRFRRLSTIPEEEDGILSDGSDEKTITQA